MEEKNRPKSFSLSSRHIENLNNYNGNQSDLVRSLLDGFFEEDSKPFEQKEIERELVGLDRAISLIKSLIITIINNVNLV